MTANCLPHTRGVAAVIERNGRFLLTQRRAGASFGGSWELPIGKVEDGESDEAALHRELYERVGVSIDVGEMVRDCTLLCDGCIVDLALYRACLLPGQKPYPLCVDDVRWVAAVELESYRLAAADGATSVRPARRRTGGA